MSDTAIDETQRKGSVVTSSTAFSNNRTAEGLRPRSHQQLARDQNAYEFNTTSSSLLRNGLKTCLSLAFVYLLSINMTSCSEKGKCSLFAINIEDAIPSGFLNVCAQGEEDHKRRKPC
ncbi:hypothetical protein BD560DRAFT_491492 [Blakeslea trispora]|nr:hypothetical protein BD560DRAFT_491492 [Blakeslea trispora]